MNIKRLTFIAAAFFVAFGVLSGPVYADIVVSCLDHEFTLKGDAAATVGEGFEGTLIITTPDGDILFLETGDKIPELPTGSRMEIFEGEFSIESGDSVIKIVANPKSGVAEIKSGVVELLTKDGTVKTLKKGTKYEMNLTGAVSETVASPTADVNPLGTTAGTGLAEPDSTNIQQSPSS